MLAKLLAQECLQVEGFLQLVGEGDVKETKARRRRCTIARLLGQLGSCAVSEK